MSAVPSPSPPELSVVIPVYNEQQVLPRLFARLYPALDALGRSYEMLFVNDGSRDRSAALLREQFERRPDVTRVVLFAGNFGQHRAILAGFAHSRGRYVITLDADLQNPPEEIGRVLEQLDAGHDYVGTIRMQRQDAGLAPLCLAPHERAARAHHARAHHRPGLHVPRLRPQRGRCGQPVLRVQHLRAGAGLYLLDAIRPRSTMAHEDRGAGESKYSMLRLMRLNFDLMTGFSTVPMQLFSVFGIVVSLLLSVLFVVFLLVRRLVVGPEAEGVFTLFAIAFFFIGVALFGIGLLGEYVGRIYDEVRHRPRYIVGSVLEQPRGARGAPV